MMCNERMMRKFETAFMRTYTKTAVLPLFLVILVIRMKNLTVFIYCYTVRNERIYDNLSRCYDYIYNVRLDFFLSSSIKIDIKAEQTSDDRKQRRACKASIVPSLFFSMMSNRKEEE